MAGVAAFKKKWLSLTTQPPFQKKREPTRVIASSFQIPGVYGTQFLAFRESATHWLG